MNYDHLIGKEVIVEIDTPNENFNFISRLEKCKSNDMYVYSLKRIAKGKITMFLVRQGDMDKGWVTIKPL